MIIYLHRDDLNYSIVALSFALSRVGRVLEY